jgi:MFS family permease
MLVSVLVYIPVARLSDSLTRTPFIILTFVFFALFPLVLSFAGSLPLVILAFVVGGLREIGEPSRKALIVDLAIPSARGRTIGLYYFIRGLVVFCASIVGGVLWKIDPRLPFTVAFWVGIAGVAAFIAMNNRMKFIPSHG